jgi:hypothetical protein
MFPQTATDLASLFWPGARILAAIDFDAGSTALVCIPPPAAADDAAGELAGWVIFEPFCGSNS